VGPGVKRRFLRSIPLAPEELNLKKMKLRVPH
jgi:hypothetical protein